MVLTFSQGTNVNQIYYLHKFNSVLFFSFICSKKYCSKTNIQELWSFIDVRRLPMNLSSVKAKMKHLLKICFCYEEIVTLILQHTRLIIPNKTQQFSSFTTKFIMGQLSLFIRAADDSDDEIPLVFYKIHRKMQNVL